MLRLETQIGAEPMKLFDYYDEAGATAACTRRLIEGAQYCGHGSNPERQRAKQNKRRELFAADAWFGSVNATNQVKAILQDEDGLPAGHDWVAAVKTNHKLYPIRELTKTMEEWPSGSHLLLSCERPDGVELLALGYKYNMRKVLCFVFTKDAGSTAPGEPYVARFPDEHGNVKTRKVPRPEVISRYFGASNVVDSHNQP
jgi:hypothetical protein